MDVNGLAIPNKKRIFYTNDVDTIDPNTLKIGDSEATKIEIGASDINTEIFAADLDITSTNFNFNGSSVVTAATNINVALSTGVLTGGDLAIGSPATTFSIADGTGVIISGGLSTSISWTGLLNQSPTLAFTGILTYVFITANNTYLTQAVAPTNDEIRDKIYLGVLVHTDGTNINAIDNQQATVLAATNQVRDLSQAIGMLNVSGNIPINSGTALKIAKSAGSIFSYGSNFINDVDNPHQLSLAAVDTATTGTFQYRWYDSVTGATSSELTLTDIVPNMLDDGTAYPTPTSPWTGATYGSNKWGVNRIYIFASNDLKLQSPQFSYNTSSEAIAAINTEGYQVEPSLVNGVLIGYLAVRGGATNLSLSSDAVFLASGKFGGSGIVGGVTTLQAAYNNSIAGTEIVTNAINNGITIQQGSGSDEDNVFVIQNGAGTTNTFSVKGNGCTNIESELVVSHVSSVSDDHTVEIIHNSAGNSDSRALEILYETGAIAANNEDDCILVSIDGSSAIAGSEVVGVAITATENNGNNIGLEVAVQIDPLLHLVGSFATPSVTNLVISWGADIPYASLAGNDLFPSDNDEIEIHDSAVFEEIEFLFDTFSSQTIQPTFWYQTVGPVWTQFGPVDGTNGFKANGVVVWNVALVPGQVADGGLYKIKIIRTRNNVTTYPVANTIKVVAINEYGWDKNADLIINDITSASVISANLDYAGTLLLGSASATKVEIGKSGVITEVKGNLDALEGLDVTGNITATVTISCNDLVASENIVCEFGSSNIIVGGADTGNALRVAGTPGVSNVFLGDRVAQYVNPSWCTYMGNQSGIYILGNSNTAIGSSAMVGNLDVISSTGYENTAVGSGCMFAIEAGFRNTAVGKGSADVLTDGDNNCFMGYDAGNTLLDGDNNTFIGATSDGGASLSNQTAIGYGAVCDATHQVTIGNANVTKIRPYSTDGKCLLGDSTNYYGDLVSVKVTTDDVDVRSGTLTLGAATATKVEIAKSGIDTEVQGYLDVFEGLGCTGNFTLVGDIIQNGETMLAFDSTSSASSMFVGTNSGASLTSVNCTLIGTNAGQFISSGTRNTVLGYNACRGITGTKLTGTSNTVVGEEAALLLQGIAQQNSIVGKSAGENTTTASYCTFLGYEAGYGYDADYNVCVGYRAGGGTVLSSGNNYRYNTILGSNAGNNTTSAQGLFNTFLGYRSGDVTTSDRGTCLGSYTDTLTYDYSIALGYKAQSTASNQLLIGSTTASEQISSIVPAIDSTTGSNGCYLGTSGARWRTMYAYNASVITSDGNLKDMDDTFEQGLDWIKKIKPMSYRWKDELAEGITKDSPQDNRTRHYGIDANQLGSLISSGEIENNGIYVREKLKPKFVPDEIQPEDNHGNPTGRYVERDDFIGIRPAELIFPLIKAVQELKEQIDHLKSAMPKTQRDKIPF